MILIKSLNKDFNLSPRVENGEVLICNICKVNYIFGIKDLAGKIRPIKDTFGNIINACFLCNETD